MSVDDSPRDYTSERLYAEAELVRGARKGGKPRSQARSGFQRVEIETVLPLQSFSAAGIGLLA